MEEKERIRKEYFIGGSKDLHSIFTMELEVTYRNGYQEFTASFNEGELVNIDEQNENARDWYSMLFDEVDAETKLRYLEDGDITKKEWIENCLRDEYDYRERIDCSCTDYELYKNGSTWNFETCGCGQHDPRDCEYFIPVNETVNELLKFWDVHHLKEITDDEKNELLKLCDKMEEFEDIEKVINERIVL